MAVQQTECYKVVTIGYLKTFISGLIQNSSGEEVKISSSYDDTLCPTYSQLTGGTIIQNGSTKSNPHNDVDGIVVNSTCLATGAAYAANQLVDRKDLSVIYTRYNSLSISAGKTELSECGDNTSFTYTNSYTRYTKSMNSSCATASTNTATTSTTTAPSSYASSNSAFVITTAGALTVDKNSSSTGQANARTTNITASVSFRGSNKTSNSVSVTQKALTGAWANWYTDYRVDSKGIDSTGSTFGCDGGTYAATAYDIRTTWMKQYWIDSCDVAYTNVTRNTGETSNVKVIVYTYNGSFSQCGNAGCESSDSTPAHWNTEGYGTKTWTQSCAPKCTCDGLVLDGDPVISFGCDTSPKMLYYHLNCEYISNISITNVDTQYLSVTRGSGYISITATQTLPNNYTSTFNINYTSSVGNCTKAITVTATNTTDGYNVDVAYKDGKDICNSSTNNQYIFKDYDIDINITKKP